MGYVLKTPPVGILDGIKSSGKRIFIFAQGIVGYSGRVNCGVLVLSIQQFTAQGKKGPFSNEDPCSHNSDPGSRSRLFAPSALRTVRVLHYYREKTFFPRRLARVELRLPTLGALSS